MPRPAIAPATLVTTTTVWAWRIDIAPMPHDAAGPCNGSVVDAASRRLAHELAGQPQGRAPACAARR